MDEILDLEPVLDYAMLETLEDELYSTLDEESSEAVNNDQVWPSQISIITESVNMEVRQEGHLSILPEPFISIAPNVIWDCSDLSVLSLRDNYIYAKKEGVAVITAVTTSKPTLTARITITVGGITPPPPIEDSEFTDEFSEEMF